MRPVVIFDVTHASIHCNSCFTLPTRLRFWTSWPASYLWPFGHSPPQR